MCNGFIFCDNLEETNENIILKISGIWENDKYYGLTYKFYKPAKVYDSNHLSYNMSK